MHNVIMIKLSWPLTHQWLVTYQVLSLHMYHILMDKEKDHRY